MPATAISILPLLQLNFADKITWEIHRWFRMVAADNWAPPKPGFQIRTARRHRLAMPAPGGAQ
jgi:hypothetical protein